MADVFQLKCNADLISLSACNIGMGEQQANEGVIGLTRALCLLARLINQVVEKLRSPHNIWGSIRLAYQGSGMSAETITARVQLILDHVREFGAALVGGDRRGGSEAFPPRMRSGQTCLNSLGSAPTLVTTERAGWSTGLKAPEPRLSSGWNIPLKSRNWTDGKPVLPPEIPRETASW